MSTRRKPVYKLALGLAYITPNLLGFLTFMPNFTTYPNITTLNVAGNHLDFASLENNRNLAGINFANQKNPVLGPDTILLESGEDFVLPTNIGGSANRYQWKRAGTTVTGAVADSLVIQDIGRTNMGSYVVEVSNDLVPTLTLVSQPVSILATANLSGKLLMPTIPATVGYVHLLRVTSSNGYDTIRTQNINASGEYAFNQVVLDDYQIVGFADTLVVGQESALPTYYESTIYWEEADTLFVENSLTDLNIVSLLEPTEPLTGSGEISGVLQEDDGTDSRTEKTRRVGGAGVSARRAQSAGRGAIELGELVAYVFTDEEGFFSMPGLTPGIYRINIQYPGYPMDPNSFIDITIGTSPLDERISVEALVAEGKITVRELVITHLEGDYAVTVHPNPAVETIHFTFENTSEQRKLILQDATGKELKQQSATEKQGSMTVREMPSGTYLLQVRDQNSVKKIIRVVIE